MAKDSKPLSTEDENKLITQRREKLGEVRARREAFPNDFQRQHNSAQLNSLFAEKKAEELEALAQTTAIAGRIMRMRGPFVVIQDGFGQMQIYMNNKTLPESRIGTLKSLDLGDIIGIEGELFKTQKGQLTVRASALRLLTKSLRPLPDKFKGLTDTETRYRQRYVDLIVNDDSRKVFALRSRILRFIRQYFDDLQFMEVETPMMQIIPGGATARPFITHHNALDQDMYLRVAPELFLKRLVVGGFEKVYELNRNFRNEGLSTKHNPEFTMLEFYWAYANYHDLMNLTEDLLRRIATEVLGTTKVIFQDTEYDFGNNFARMTMTEAICCHCNVSEAEFTDAVAVFALAKKLGVHCEDSWPAGKVIMAIFEAKVEEHLDQPTFIYHHPTAVSPLSRRNEENPEVTDRFELFIAGRELANGFSELNDPEDQAERFHAQVAQKESGDQEAMHFDDDYIAALEYGMPPTAGEGIGIDRLIMLFTNSPSIKDVLLFPHLRPQHDQS